MQHEITCDSLAENNSIRLQAEANTGRKPSRSWRRFTGGCRRGRAARHYRAILDGAGAVWPLFCDCPGSRRCRMAARKKGEENRFFAGDPEKPLEFNHEDNDPVDILITMAAG